MKNKKGFSLIEVLVVVAIIALVGTLAAVAVSSARSKQRDATRLANVRQLQSALEDHFNETNSYPPGEGIPLGDARSACLGVGGFQGDCSSDSTVFLRVVIGTYQDGLNDHVLCGEPLRNALCYTTIREGEDYRIEFELENGLNQVGLIKGPNCALPTGMEAGRCQ